MPLTMRLIGALHGPSRVTCPNAYVPAGTTTLLLVVDEQASDHALSKAYEE